jgi:exopolysaccharide production protein ExoQ
MTSSSSSYLPEIKKTNRALVQLVHKLALGLVLFGILRAEIPVLSQLHPGALITAEASDMGILVKLVLFVLYFLLLLPNSSSFIRHLFSTIGLISRKNFPLVLLYIVASFSVFWSTDPEATLRAALLGVGTTTVIAMYVGREVKTSDLLNFSKWIFGAVVLLAFVMPGAHEKGLASVWGHPNKMGILASLSAVSWYLNLAGNRQNKLLSLMFIGLSLLVLSRTNSAGGLLICLLFIAVTIYLERKTSFDSKFSVDYRAVFLAALLMVISIFSALVLLVFRVGDLVSLLGRDMTFTGRTYLWPSVIEAIQQKLYLGYGLNGFWQFWRDRDNPALVIDTPGLWVAPNAHNGFLDLTLELGLVGLILFVVSYLVTLRQVLKYLGASKKTEVILLVVIMLLIPMMNLMETELFGANYIWFYYILITTKLCSLKIESRPAPTDCQELLIPRKGAISVDYSGS